MGRASLIIVAGFIFAFSFMNLSLNKTGSNIVENYSREYERLNAQNAVNSVLNYYIYEFANFKKTAPGIYHEYTVKLNSESITPTVNITADSSNTIF